jgi:hypothetical protein
MARVRVVIEYDVPKGTSGSKERARALAMAQEEYGKALVFCSYELVPKVELEERHK